MNFILPNAPEGERGTGKRPETAAWKGCPTRLAPPPHVGGYLYLTE